MTKKSCTLTLFFLFSATGCQTVDLNKSRAPDGGIDTSFPASHDTDGSTEDETDSTSPQIDSDTQTGTGLDADTDSDNDGIVHTESDEDSLTGTADDTETGFHTATDGDTESEPTGSEVDTASEVGTGTVNDTGTGTVNGTGDVSDTGTGDVSDAGTGTAVDTGTGDVSDTVDTVDVSDTSTDTAVDTGTSEPVNTGTGTAIDTGTGEPIDTGTGEPIDTGTGEPIDTGTGTAIDTGSGTAIDTGVIESGTLVHRWSFNNSLADAVGSSNAEIVGPFETTDTEADTDTETGGPAVLSGSQITLSGGEPSLSECVSLGANLLTDIGGPLTIELWATQESVVNWTRMIEFGASGDEYLVMTWTVGEDINTDLVRWRRREDAITLIQEEARDTNAPYRVGVEYHIVLTVNPGGGTGGIMRIAWHTAEADAGSLGGENGSFETEDTLANFDDANAFLGKSHHDWDLIANASYNEVRIWEGVLSQEDLERLHDLGPDVPILFLPE